MNHGKADEDADQAHQAAQTGQKGLLMFSQDKADAICAALSSGSSLRSAAKSAGVGVQTVLDWTKANEAFSGQYARAREVGYALLADDIIQISDEAEYEPVPGAHPEDEPREVRFDNTAVARNRLRVDSRKWMLSKMLPKIYGDKIEATHELGDSIRAVVREIVRP